MLYFDLFSRIMRIVGFATALCIYTFAFPAMYLGRITDDRLYTAASAFASLSAFCLFFLCYEYEAVVKWFGRQIILATHRRERILDNLRRMKSHRLADAVRPYLLRYSFDEHYAAGTMRDVLRRITQLVVLTGALVVMLGPASVRPQLILSSLAALLLVRTVRHAVNDAYAPVLWGYQLRLAREYDCSPKDVWPFC